MKDIENFFGSQKPSKKAMGIPYEHRFPRTNSVPKVRFAPILQSFKMTSATIYSSAHDNISVYVKCEIVDTYAWKKEFPEEANLKTITGRLLFDIIFGAN